MVSSKAPTTMPHLSKLNDEEFKSCFTEAMDRNQEQLKLSAEEQKKFTEAMKKPEFNKLLREYMDEISDPKHRAEQEQYLRELEAENKVPGDMKLIRPKAGFCVKTRFVTGGEGKVFVNICSSEEIDPPASEIQEIDGGRGQSWSLPLALGPRRMEKDKKGNPAPTFDLAFHPETLQRSKANPRFQQMVVELALENIETRSTEIMQTEVKLERKHHVLRGNKCMGGTPATMTTRVNSAGTKTTQPSQVSGQQSKQPPANSKIGPNASSIAMHEKVKRKLAEQEAARRVAEETCIPEHTVVHRGVLDLGDFMKGPSGRREAEARAASRPKELVVKIKLPALRSARHVNLDVSESTLKLDCEPDLAGAEYHLDLALPFSVLDEEGSAKWDKNLRQLVVTLPVRKPDITPKTTASSLTGHVTTTTMRDREEEAATPSPAAAASSEKTEPLVQEIDRTKSNESVSSQQDSAAPVEHGRWVTSNSEEELDPDIAAARAAALKPLPIPAEERTATLVEETPAAKECVSEPAVPSVDESKIEALTNIERKARKTGPRSFHEKQPAQKPAYVQRQTIDTVTVLVQVSDIEDNSADVDFRPTGTVIKFIADNRDYQLALRVPDANETTLDTDACRFDISEMNMAIVLKKQKSEKWISLLIDDDPGIEDGIAGTESSVEEITDFTAASSFAGSRPGFVFKSDKQGLGYYRDVPPVVEKKSDEIAGHPKKPYAAPQNASVAAVPPPVPVSPLSGAEQLGLRNAHVFELD